MCKDELNELREEFEDFRDNHFSHFESHVVKTLGSIQKKVDSRTALYAFITSIVTLITLILK